MKALFIDKIAILRRKRIADLMNSSKSGAVVSNLLKSDQIGDYSRRVGSMDSTIRLTGIRTSAFENPA